MAQFLGIKVVIPTSILKTDPRLVQTLGILCFCLSIYWGVGPAWASYSSAQQLDARLSTIQQRLSKNRNTASQRNTSYTKASSGLLAGEFTKLAAEFDVEILELKPTNTFKASDEFEIISYKLTARGPYANILQLSKQLEENIDGTTVVSLETSSKRLDRNQPAELLTCLTLRCLKAIV